MNIINTFVLFQLNQILEVIDPVTRYRIIPGIITEIFNKYYFRVSLLYSNNEQNPPSIICHKGSPDILFANFCSRSMLRLAAPDGTLFYGVLFSLVYFFRNR